MRSNEAAEARDFFDNHYPAVFRYAMYLTSDAETAQEICQEVFLRWFRLGSADDIQFPRAWLKKVCAHLATDHLRRQNLRLRVETTLDEETQDRACHDQEIIRLEVTDILNRLSWRDQMLLKLRMSGFSYREIAEVMDLSVGSVGTLLNRSMKRFREEYDREEAVKNDKMSG